MRLVTQRSLRAEYAVGRSNNHLLRLEAQRRFTRRLKIGGDRTAWFAHEIEAWLRSLGEARGKPIRYPTTSPAEFGWGGT
jgi:predicted DNA-binding transcriptional regulator AlpA